MFCASRVFTLDSCQSGPTVGLPFRSWSGVQFTPGKNVLVSLYEKISCIYKKNYENINYENYLCSWRIFYDANQNTEVRKSGTYILKVDS